MEKKKKRTLTSASLACYKTPPGLQLEGERKRVSTTTIITI